MRVWLSILSVVLVAVVVAGAFVYLQWMQSQAHVERLEEQVDDLDRKLDVKESFGESMAALMQTVKALEGAPVSGLVDYPDYQRLATEAWKERHTVLAVQAKAEAVDAHAARLEAVLARAQTERASNVTGSFSEDLMDEHGQGFAHIMFDDAGAVCDDSDAIGCVAADAPHVIHLDDETMAHESMDDWGRRMLTLHEFAHVLQFTNPEVTESALSAFDGDEEFMADCYALTITDEDTLDHRVWIGGGSYWDVSYGYGEVCDARQRDVIRDWIDDVAVEYRPLTPEESG